MKQFALWAGSLLVVLVVLGIGASLGWYKYQQIMTAAAEPPPPESPIAVIVRPATEVSYRLQTSSIGTVMAPQFITLSNEIAGSVSKLGFKPGDEVAEGQVLLELDTSVERAKLVAAEARVKIAKSTLNRTQRAKQAVSELEVEEADAKYAQAVAEVAELKAIIERKTLRAPFRAKIGMSNTHVGQFLASGAQITTLQSIDNFVHVDFMVPQSAADSVKVGQAITLSEGQHSAKAEIIAIDAQSDRATRNLMARAKLSPVPENLRPGDSVKVVIEYGPEMKTAAVPLEAIRRAPMRTYVYIAEADKENKLRAHEQQVTVGPMIDNRFSILSGIEPNMSVVADGSFKLHEGALIAAMPLPERQTVDASNATPLDSRK
jgi:membrane fusion protein, multidrug efflux system